jgi:hypothetical protein
MGDLDRRILSRVMRTSLADDMGGDLRGIL